MTPSNQLAAAMERAKAKQKAATDTEFQKLVVKYVDDAANAKAVAIKVAALKSAITADTKARTAAEAKAAKPARESIHYTIL